MSRADLCFNGHLQGIMTWGKDVDTRNSITRRQVGLGVTFDRTPLVSIRKTSWKSAIREFEWFMSGSSNLKDLHPSVHPWWKPWADVNGEIKNNYSKQFRAFSSFEFLDRNDEAKGIRWKLTDQLHEFVKGIQQHPFSRRNVITTWNTGEMLDPTTPITNCHGTIIQAFCNPDETLELYMYQRSCDMLLGVPHNWIQYWAFLLWLGVQTDKKPGCLMWQGGDCHIYQEHYELVQEIDQKINLVKEGPQLVYKGKPGDPFRADDFELDGPYEPVITTKAKMVV